MTEVSIASNQQSVADSVKILEPNLEAPAWDLSSEYPSIDSPEFRQDYNLLKNMIEEIAGLGSKLSPFLSCEGVTADNFSEALKIAIDITALEKEILRISSDLYVYADCVLAVDGDNVSAKKYVTRLQDLDSEIDAACVPLSYFLATITDEQVKIYLENPIAAENGFYVTEMRKHSFQRMLSAKEEAVLALFASNGLDSWENLHRDIASSARIELIVKAEKKTVGLSEANEFLSDPDREIRKHAWEEISKTWKRYEEPAAASVNALAAWRHKENRLRSAVRPKHFLEDALHSGRVSPETVEAMFAVVKENLPVARHGLSLAAKTMDSETYEPWDKYAPLPAGYLPVSSERITFPQGFADVQQAFRCFHPDLGNFMNLCLEKKWIEARLMSSKIPGAFSTGFTGSGEPRTYLSWSGTNDNKRTLAHESGHSLHTWVMHDLPAIQRYYPMTLAETASNIGEMLWADYETSLSKDSRQILAMLWDDVQSGADYLINLPLRFDFEKTFYERRQQDLLTPDELTELMIEKHKEWYGDIMTVQDGMFWASKAHFHTSGISFYNYPYVFGYLLGLGIHSMIKEHGSDFYTNFVSLLRDTGRMTAEDVASQHLGVDIKRPEFWQRCYNVFAAKVAKFEDALAGLKA